MQHRHYAVPFDPDFFARRATEGESVPPIAAFRHAYATNLWAGPESRSGLGASLDQTAAIRLDLLTSSLPAAGLFSDKSLGLWWVDALPP